MLSKFAKTLVEIARRREAKRNAILSERAKRDQEVEEKLIQPTFVTQYPLDVSPLSRKNEADPFCVDRFELFIFGREIANAFSELNDPLDQKERFLKQAEAKKQGDLEATDMAKGSPCRSTISPRWGGSLISIWCWA